MDSYINATSLHLYCNTNETLLSAPPSAFVLEFPGLGGDSCLGGHSKPEAMTGFFARAFAEHGILHAFLFVGPWSWMNRGTVRITNAIVRAIREKYNLPASTPYAVMGGSMGGLGALMYSADAETTPTACLAVCPCVNVPDRFDAHPEFPRTFLCAIAEYDLPPAEALRELSPIHRLTDMPNIPYYVINDVADEVFPAAQLDDYVAALRARGASVDYERLPDKKHGELTPNSKEHIRRFLISHLTATENKSTGGTEA